jgi:hypothetical protein
MGDGLGEVGKDLTRDGCSIFSQDLNLPRSNSYSHLA